MSDFNALKFVADNAGLNIFKALEKAYEQGKADAKVDAITLDWLESYAQMMVDDDRPIFAESIQKMVDEWKQEQAPHCGPDYCEIGGDHE